jgi:hypothetical protein
MHYVYFAHCDGELVYIGEGKLDRYLKIISGTSHCYEANKAHFEGRVVTSEIVEHFKTKQEAQAREKELIKNFKPKWNTTHNEGLPLMRYKIRKRVGKKRTVWTVYMVLDKKECSLRRYWSEQDALDYIGSIKIS